MSRVVKNKLGYLVATVTGLVCLAAPMASAQERLPIRLGGAGDLNGARYIKPGALLFATFDTNQDFVISEEEIESGARRTFQLADADGNGVMTPLEQRDWALKIGSDTDVIANPTTFPSGIPGQVNEEEFVFGLQTFAQRFQDPDDADQRILVKNFTFEPDRSRRQDRKDEDELERVRRPVISDRRDANGIR